MDQSEKSERHQRKIARIGGGLFANTEKPEIPPMGENYRQAVSDLFAKRDEMSNTIRRELAWLPPEELVDTFGPNGEPISEKGRDLVARFRREMEAAFGRLKPWYSAPLFCTKQLADFEHWAKHEFLSLDEVVWLSVGLEPEDRFVPSIKEYDERGNKQKLDEVTTYMSRHREVIRRKFDPYNQKHKPKFADLFVWINEVNLTVHSGFYELVSHRAAAPSKTAIPDVPDKIDSKFDGRERTSMVKLIAAMAIDAFGFDPTEKRSEIPSEIEGIADRLGLRTKNSKTFTTYFMPVDQMYTDCFRDWVQYLKTELLFGPDDPLFPPPEMGIVDGQFAVVGLKRQTYQNANAIRAAVKQAFENAGLPTFAPHSFRKTLTVWADKHYPTREAFKAFSQKIGHESVVTTVSSYFPVSTERQGELIKTPKTSV